MDGQRARSHSSPAQRAARDAVTRVRLAQEGADIIAVDTCDQVSSVRYAMATPGDLAQTAKEVKALDRRIVATQADVRDYAELKRALDGGVAQLGRLDIVCSNAGIFSTGRR